MPNQDGTGPRSSSTGPRDGRGGGTQPQNGQGRWKKNKKCQNK